LNVTEILPCSGSKAHGLGARYRLGKCKTSRDESRPDEPERGNKAERGRRAETGSAKRGPQGRRKTRQAQDRFKVAQSAPRGVNSTLAASGMGRCEGEPAGVGDGACAPLPIVPLTRAPKFERAALAREDRGAREAAFAARYRPRVARVFCGAERPQGHAGVRGQPLNLPSRNLLHRRHSAGLEAGPELPAPLASP
jgi:hypothetical protein